MTPRLRAFIGRYHRLVLGGLLVIHAALLLWSAWVHSPVIDEPAHLAAGLHHWRTGEFSLYRVNPPLVRMVATAPLLASDIAVVDWHQDPADLATRYEFALGNALIRTNGSAIFRYTSIARSVCVVFSLVGAIACYSWARLLFGKLAGLLSATLWCFSPMVLGHGSLMTPDCQSALKTSQ